MGSLAKSILESAGGTVLLSLQKSLRKKSPDRVERFGTKLGRLFYRVAKRRRERAVTNLGIAFPEMPYDERAALAQRTFEHFGRVACDFLASKGRTLAQLDSTMEVVGREHLEEAIATGKGTLLVTGHFGNFERIPAWLSLSGYKMNSIIRDADQEGVNQIVNEIRTSPGTSVIARGNAPRRILSCLRANEIVGIISDQNAEDAFLPFFGKLAGTNLGAGVILERTGATALPCVCTHEGPSRYKLTFYPALVPVPDCELKGEGYLRAMNSWLEGVIRQYPDQWLWFHDRWRNAREAGLL